MSTNTHPVFMHGGPYDGEWHEWEGSELEVVRLNPPQRGRYKRTDRPREAYFQGWHDAPELEPEP